MFIKIKDISITSCRDIWRKQGAGVMLLILFFCVFYTSRGDVVRFGINSDEVFPYERDRADNEGWILEELKEWGDRNNHEVQFMVREWGELEKEFSLGRIDAIYPANRSPEREAHMGFTGIIKREPISIFSRERGRVSSLEALADTRVGVIDSEFLREELSPFLADAAYYPSSQDAVRGLVEGKVDYIILGRDTVNLYSNRLYVVGDMWFDNEGGIGVQKGRTDLLDSLNSHFFDGEKQLRSSIGEKILKRNMEAARYKVDKFLNVREPRVLRVVIHKEAVPFVRVEKGELRSGLMDFAQLFNELSPYIKLEVVPVWEQMSYNEELKRLEAGEVDIFLPVGITEERDKRYRRAESEGINFTDYIILLANKNSKNISSVYEARDEVGTYNSNALKEILTSNMKEERMRVFDSRVEALGSLDRGEIKYLIDTNMIADSYLSLKNYTNIKKISSLGRITYGVYFSPDTPDEVLGDFNTIMNVLSNRWDYEKTEGSGVSPYFIKNYVIMIKSLLIATLVLFIFYQRRHLREKANNEKIFRTLIESLESVNHVNNEETGEHIVRIGLYSRVISKQLNLPKSYVKEIKLFSSLHDVGKIGISRDILSKPGKLSPEEFEEMKLHTVKGAEIVKTLSEISVRRDIAYNIALYHHERWDGGGYPKGLTGEEIPLEARIVAIADVYDALRMPRVYKEGFSHTKSYRIISEGAGTHFDPELVEIFKRKHLEFNRIYHQNS